MLTVAILIEVVLQVALPAVDAGTGNATQSLLLFQKLFEKRRAEHKAAVQSLLSMNEYAKQHKMISLTLDRVFEVLEVSQDRLRQAGFVPGNEFPLQEDIRDALSQTLETTCLLGEVLLHLPTITHNVLDARPQRRTLLSWGVFFTAHSNFLPRHTKTLVHLMTQELGMAERDPDYINPYAPKTDTETDDRKQKPAVRKKKKTFKKGPSLSRQYGDL